MLELLSKAGVARLTLLVKSLNDIISPIIDKNIVKQCEQDEDLEDLNILHNAVSLDDSEYWEEWEAYNWDNWEWDEDDYLGVEILPPNLIKIANEILSKNDSGYWLKNSDKLSQLFISTPSINQYPEQVVKAYFDFLNDVKNNWMTYFPLLTRSMFYPYKIYERLEYAIKFMTIDYDLHNRRQLSKVESEFDKECSKIESSSLELDSAVGKLVKNEISVSEDKKLKRKVEELFEIIRSLSTIEELPQRNFNNSEEYLLEYKHFPAKPFYSRSSLSYLANLVELEIRSNNEMLKMGKEPKFNIVTNVVKELLVVKKINEFETLVNNCCQTLASKLNEYIKSSDGDAEKVKLAKDLDILLAALKPADAVTKCTHIRFHVQNIQRFHLSLLLNKNILSGRFGEILDFAFATFNQLEKQISLENCKSLAELVEANLEIIEDSRTVATFSR